MWNVLESRLNDEFIRVLVTLDSLVYQTASSHESPSSYSFHAHVRIICLLCCAVILAKYGMDGKRDTRPLESNYLKDHDIKEGDIFDDPRLDKLWNKVWICTENGRRKILKYIIRTYFLFHTLFNLVLRLNYLGSRLQLMDETLPQLKGTHFKLARKNCHTVSHKRDPVHSRFHQKSFLGHGYKVLTQHYQ